MTHLHCNIGGKCGWKGEDAHLHITISAYLAHVIRDHWDILQYAHDHPGALDEAERMSRS